MQVIESALDGVRIVEPAVRADARGTFLEFWQRSRYAEAGLPSDWVQCNVSRSRQGVLRGLHLQHPLGQAKLVMAVTGRVFDVAVDVRRGSASFGRWLGAELSEENGQQLFIPEGFAHGYLVLSEEAVIVYQTTRIHEPSSEIVIRWNDPLIAVRWPEPPRLLSDRDRAAPRLDEVIDRLPLRTS